MSKKGGFREWMEKNEKSPSKSVLYEQKYQKKKQRSRNNSEGEFVSMVNPQPTAEDYARYDADRRFRETARDFRVAQRSASSSSLSSLRFSPPNEEYFTPTRESGGNLDDFATPAAVFREKSSRSTSRRSSERRKEHKRHSEPGTSTTTPTRVKPPRHDISEHRRFYTEYLSRRLDRNFEKLNETAPELPQIAPISTRSSSVPPPMFSPGYKTPEPPKNEEKEPEKVIEEKMTYVETLLVASRMHRNYQEVAGRISDQMTRLEALKFLKDLAASTRPRLSAGADRQKTEQVAETPEQIRKKWEKIDELKERFKRIATVQESTHKLLFSSPFEIPSDDVDLVAELDTWIALPFAEFDVKTARMMETTLLRTQAEVERYKHVKRHRSMASTTVASGRESRRKSSICKILPSIADDQPTPQSKEAGTQVTARSRESSMTQTSPRRVGVEPLDLSSLSQPRRSSTTQTTPRTFANAQTVTDIDAMLDNIQLLDQSLETIELKELELNVSQVHSTSFKSDISFPPPTPEEQTPRSGRVSLDSASARRLSEGVAHFLEQYKEQQAAQELPPPPKVTLTSPTNSSGTDPDFNKFSWSSASDSTPEKEDDTSGDTKKSDDTEFEHEKEEKEEQIGKEEKEEEEGDETKKFVNRDEFEKTFDDDSADDSGFLLNNKPPPKLTSILDNWTPQAPQAQQDPLRSDTPRVVDDGANETVETTFDGIDLEDYCHNEYLAEIGPIMVRKALELQSQLAGADLVTALAAWEPPSFRDMQMQDHYDAFEYFDSFSVLVWGSVVEVLNRYTRDGRVQVQAGFEEEALETLQKEFGGEAKRREWCREVPLPKKLEGMVPIALDYRYDDRRSMPEIEKQRYQWQRAEMMVLHERYQWLPLQNELNAVIADQLENLGHQVVTSSLEENEKSS